MKAQVILWIVAVATIFLAACPLPDPGLFTENRLPTPSPKTLGFVTFSGKAQFATASGSTDNYNVKLGMFRSYGAQLTQFSTANQSVNLGKVNLSNVEFSFTVNFANLPYSPIPSTDILVFEMWEDTNDNGLLDPSEKVNSNAVGQASDPLFGNSNSAQVFYYSSTSSISDANWVISWNLSSKLINANTTGLRLVNNINF